MTYRVFLHVEHFWAYDHLCEVVWVREDGDSSQGSLSIRTNADQPCPGSHCPVLPGRRDAGDQPVPGAPPGRPPASPTHTQLALAPGQRKGSGLEEGCGVSSLRARRTGGVRHTYVRCV